MTKYTKEEVLESLQSWFNDDLKASTFLKYILQDKYQNFYEKTPDEVFHRLAKELARIEKKYPNPLSEDAIFDYLRDFSKIIFQGSPMAGIGNDYQITSLSNCFVINSPEDCISGIINTARDMSNIFKRRGGVGIDISSLRPEGTPVNNSAKTSTGAWSFADLYSFVSKKIGQNGRRAALMLTMSIYHPDAMKFARSKADGKSISGANISLKVDDNFFEAVINNKNIIQQWPLDVDNPKIVQEANAREMFDEICQLACDTGDPGLLFWDNIVNNLPAHLYEQYNTLSVNPCGELPLSPMDSCRLLSHNLTSYVKDPFTEKAWFDFDSLYKDTMVAQRLADDLVDLEIEKLDRIIAAADTEDEKDMFLKIKSACSEGRRTGVGTQGPGDVFIMLGMTYGDESSIEITEAIYKTRMNASYHSSAILAKERGCFPIWDWDLEKDHIFMKKLDKDVYDLIKKYGRRNISNLTNAPTGSIAIVAGTTPGMEPNFAFTSVRKKRKSHDDEPLDSDYIDDRGERWEQFQVLAPIVKRWQDAGNDPNDLPSYFIESNDVDIDGRLAVQAAAQQFIDHSISNTFNLPKGTKVETIKDIYMKAWKNKVKGVTVFVDGCKEGILSRKEFGKYQKKRPEILDCEIHTATVKKEKWTIIVGLIDGCPYEVFGGLSEEIELPPKVTKGKITKISYKTRAAAYNLQLDSGIVIKDIGRVFNNDLYQVHTRMVSLGLRHGAEPSFIAEQLLKDKADNDLTSFSKVLARVLKHYIDNGTKVTSEKVCTECGAENLIYQDGCPTCMSCGNSKCG